MIHNPVNQVSGESHNKTDLVKVFCFTCDSSLITVPYGIHWNTLDKSNYGMTDVSHVASADKAKVYNWVLSAPAGPGRSSLDIKPCSDLDLTSSGCDIILLALVFSWQNGELCSDILLSIYKNCSHRHIYIIKWVFFPPFFCLPSLYCYDRLELER